MLATFRETLTSLQDKYYGKVISTRSLPQAIWYWSKYLLLLFLIPIVLAIILLTYFVPQLPHLLETKLPEFSLSIKQNRLVQFSPQPFSLGNSDFSLLIDVSGQEVSLADYKAGILIQSDKIITKDPNGSVTTQPFQNLKDFDLSRPQVISWTKDHTLLVWALGLSALSIAVLIMGSLSWAFQISTMSLWSMVLWVVGRLIHRPLPYQTLLKLALYASVLPLIVSAVNVLSSNTILEYLSVALFLFYFLSWFWHLTSPPPTISRK